MPQTIFGVLFIFLMTTLGSAVVFFFKKKVNKNFNKTPLICLKIILLILKISLINIKRDLT